MSRRDDRAAPAQVLRVAASRSVTLLRVFLVASAAILIVAGVVLSSTLTTTLERQTLDERRRSLASYVDGVLRQQLVADDRLVIAPDVSERLLASLHRERDIRAVKVWASDGTLVWASAERQRIGTRFPLDDHLAKALTELESTAEIETVSRADEESAAEHALGGERLLEVYTPLLSSDGTRAIGAYEIYSDATRLDAITASRNRLIWITVGLVFLALAVALALLVRTASGTLRAQTAKLRERSKQLLDSYRRLEESALESIEILNATVEAKDPYTAGHSRRVQQIALAIGEELGLGAAQLEALRYGSLFHDIGKLGVPDAVLLKPGPLDEAEQDLIRAHAHEGARIVGS